MSRLFHTSITVFSGRLISDKQSNAPTPQSTLEVMFQYRGCNYAVRPVRCYTKLLWEMRRLQATLADN